MDLGAAAMDSPGPQIAPIIIAPIDGHTEYHANTQDMAEAAAMSEDDPSFPQGDGGDDDEVIIVSSDDDDSENDDVIVISDDEDDEGPADDNDDAYDVWRVCDEMNFMTSL